MTLAACGSSGEAGDEGKGGGASGTDAVELLERGFAAEIESGVLDAKLTMDMTGAGAPDDPIRVDLFGPFESTNAKTSPDLELEISASGAGEEPIEATVVAKAGNAYVEFEGVAYEVGRDVVRRLLEGSEKGPRTLDQAGIDPLEWITDARVEGESMLSGVETTEVSATADVRKVVEDFNGLAKRVPGGEAFSGRVVDEIVEVVDEVDFRAWIDEDDVVRRLATRIEADLPPELADGADGIERVVLDLDVRIEDPNEPVEIRTPADPKPIGALLRQLGIPPDALLGPGAQLAVPG